MNNNQLLFIIVCIIIFAGFITAKILSNQDIRDDMQAIKKDLASLKGKPISVHLTQYNINHVTGDGHGFGESNSITSTPA